MDSNYWYCFVINATSYHSNKEKVVQEITNILNNKIISILVIDTKEMIDSGEYFIFVECKNVIKNKEDILKLSIVIRIISNGNTPYVFSEKEVDSFRKSIVKKDNSFEFKRGDIVFIKEGSFKNLFGLVLSNKLKKVRVFLKFHVRSFIEEIEPKFLKKEKNIFDFQPSNIERKDWFNKFIG